MILNAKASIFSQFCHPDVTPGSVSFWLNSDQLSPGRRDELKRSPRRCCTPVFQALVFPLCSDPLFRHRRNKDELPGPDGLIGAGAGRSASLSRGSECKRVRDGWWMSSFVLKTNLLFGFEGGSGAARGLIPNQCTGIIPTPPAEAPRAEVGAKVDAAAPLIP